MESKVVDNVAMCESEEEEEDYVINVPSNFQPNDRGLGFQLFSSMEKYKNSVAQFITDNEGEQTYGELLKKSIRTALHLRDRGLNNNDVVMLCSNNHENSCIPFIASLFLGVPVASLDPALSIMDTSHLLKEVTPKIMFVVSHALEMIETSLLEADIETEIVIFGSSDKYTEFADFLQFHEDEEKFIPVYVSSLQETAVIFFSSGTTGIPKGIMINHYTLMGQTDNLIKSGNIGNVQLSYSSLYWISSVIFLSVVICTGGVKVVCQHFNPEELWFHIEKYKISSLFLSPSQAVDMVKAGRPDHLDTTSLWTCFTGGAALSEKYVETLRDLLPGCFVFQVYGQSEVAGILTQFKTNQVRDCLYLHQKPRSVGVAVAGFKYKIVDTDTEIICGPNKPGELRVKSKFVMNGYFKKDSSESFDSDGWLRTGDVVYYDEDGCFFVVDRIKEMLKYKSWHIAPAVLEQILVNHPAVKEALVIGIPHEEDGDLPMALLTLNDNFREKITGQDIESYVEDKVPDRMKLRGE
ncbi:luciferin 4-monooxygenase [Leptinotarsa decemlineata]|uniref:luciferin 4-monooxygenase n=1 Tax=Leptinotarsa decemlineata TaxID=7539 RepID=UPI003D308FDB